MSNICPRIGRLFPLDSPGMTPDSFRAFDPEIAAQISTGCSSTDRAGESDRISGEAS